MVKWPEQEFMSKDIDLTNLLLSAVHFALLDDY